MEIGRVMRIPSSLRRGELAWVEGDTLLFQNNIIGHIYIKTLPGIHSFFYSFIPSFIYFFIHLILID
jgi:hypothetical protein